MSNQGRDYAALRRSVEQSVARQKRNYRIVFFVMHLIFFLTAMFFVWGSLAANPQLQDLLTLSGSSTAIVLIPTILWACVVLFHVAFLYLESAAGEKTIRQQVLMRELGEEILRQGLAGEIMSEKPKHDSASLETGYSRLSDDGELIPDDDVPYAAHASDHS